MDTLSNLETRLHAAMRAKLRRAVMSAEACAILEKDELEWEQIGRERQCIEDERQEKIYREAERDDPNDGPWIKPVKHSTFSVRK